MSWSTTDTLPERRHGPGWATSAPSSERRGGPGWFSLLEKVAPFTGDGTLSGTPRPRYAITVAFTGSGELTTTLVLRNSRTATLTSTGDLVGEAYQLATRTAVLSGSGQFDLAINDGLSAIVQAGLAAWFSGGGTLLVDTEGGAPPADGLTASLVGRYLIPAYFDSVGELIGNLGDIKQSLADLGSDGILTADTAQIYGLLGDLVGSGALSAVAFRNTFDVLGPLLGSGALSATEFAKYLTSVGFTGAGAFTALLLQIHSSTSGAGGVGTMTALIMQKYSFAPALTGGGILSALTGQIYSPDPALSGDGTLSATVVPTASIAGTLVYLVTIDHTKVAGDLTDFPVYIDLNSMPEGFWDAAGDGSGIRCYIGATELACEVFPTYNELHTKVPALSSSTDTVITVLPDGGASPLGSDEVWSNDYVSVYHMGEDPSVSILDSVGGYDAVPTTAGATASYGVMGYGLYLDGATTMEADLAGIVTGSNPRTMSAWVYTETAGNLTIWGQGTNDLGTLWEMVRYGGNLILHAYGGGFDTISVSAPIADATPAYCCLTYDGTTVRVYLDGNFMGQVDMDLDTGTTFNNVGGPGYFGQWADIIDEARLSAVERSAEWIETEYLNQIDPAGFYSVAESSGGMTGNGILTATATEQYAITAGFGDT